MDKAVLGGYLEGFKAVVGGVGTTVVSRLLFADDTLMFCDADEIQLLFHGKVLIWLQVVPGRKINLRKCEIIPIGAMNHIFMLVQVLQSGSTLVYLWALPSRILVSRIQLFRG